MGEREFGRFSGLAINGLDHVEVFFRCLFAERAAVDAELADDEPHRMFDPETAWDGSSNGCDDEGCVIAVHQAPALGVKKLAHHELVCPRRQLAHIDGNREAVIVHLDVNRLRCSCRYADGALGGAGFHRSGEPQLDSRRRLKHLAGNNIFRYDIHVIHG